jgi:predicted RND superfamily exporter protein
VMKWFAGLGVDDMFILMAGFRQTDIRLSIEERISETFRSSAISVTITSLTDLLAFCIGATSPFLSIRNFCVYAGSGITATFSIHFSNS